MVVNDGSQEATTSKMIPSSDDVKYPPIGGLLVGLPKDRFDKIWSMIAEQRCQQQLAERNAKRLVNTNKS